MTLPSPRVTTVGYQRPCAIFGVLLNVFATGSKVAACSCPSKGSYCMVPLAMNGRPSSRSTMPLQNMSQDRENWLIVCPLTGANSNAPELLDGPYGGPDGHPDADGGQFPDPATTSTLPLLSSAAWTGLIGMVLANVVHWPCTLA